MMNKTDQPIPRINPAQAMLSAIFALLFLCLMPSAANAQTVTQYTNTTAGAIPESTTCASTLSRTFTVGTSFTVSDVNLGLVVSHAYRADLRATLTSPAGTVVTLTQYSGGSADNLNVLFDDESSSGLFITSHFAADSAVFSSPYAKSFIPRNTAPIAATNALSLFDGQNAQGTWTLNFCDNFATDIGNFVRADLFLTQQPTNFADLSLTKTVSSATPASGSNITYTLSVTNDAASTQAATGVSVRDILPVGVSYVSATGTGTYNSGTGIWTVGNVPTGATRSITLTVNVTASAGSIIQNGGEISASGQADRDSTVNNNSVNEDDDAFVSFTVQGTRVAGTPPTLNCPVGSVLLDWNAQSWTSGSLTGTANLAGIGAINFGVTTQGSFNVPLGLSNAITGGLASTEVGLYQNIEYTNRSQTTTTTITLPTGIPGTQFTIFDVDYAANDFADQLTVTGSYNGSPVSPTLTNGASNYIFGNSAYGDVLASDTTNQGNVIVTFNAPVDTIIVSYGNHSTAPPDPDGQAITIHDFNFCRPFANLSVTKLSNVISDGVSVSNPKAIPGATVEYCITVQNAGSGRATNVNVADAIPATLTYVPNTMRSGASCGTAATSEDDDASDAGETDGTTMSAAGANITGIVASIAPLASKALVFNTLVN
jgi:uncharacterized repeat protein (TIGR01451 family)